MLKKIVENIVTKNILNEITVQDGYETYYSEIPEDNFRKIIETVQGDNNVLLPNTKWVLECFKKNPSETMKYLHILRNENKMGALDLWERIILKKMLVGNESSLDRFQRIIDLYNFIYRECDIDEVLKRTQGEWSRAVRAAKNDITKYYEDENWFVISPNSMDASCYWGNGTEWCTATRNEENNMWDHYNSQGHMFIIINKQTKDKYQLHFESGQFKDAEDNEIERPAFKTIGASDGLIRMFKDIAIDNYEIYSFLGFTYNVLASENNGYIPVSIESNQYNVVDINTCELAFPDLIFLRPFGFRNETAPVIYIKNDGSYKQYCNIVNVNKEFLYDEDKIVDIGEPVREYVMVKTNGGFTTSYVSLATGEFLGDDSNAFYDGDDVNYYYNPEEACAIVRDENEKENLFSMKLERAILPIYVDELTEVLRSLFIARNGDKYAIADSVSGMNLSNNSEWYDNIETRIFKCGWDMVKIAKCSRADKLYDVYNLTERKCVATSVEMVGNGYERFLKHSTMRDCICVIKSGGKYNLLSFLSNKYVLSKWFDRIIINSEHEDYATKIIGILNDEIFEITPRAGNEEYYNCRCNENDMNENKNILFAEKISCNLNNALLLEITVNDGYNRFFKDMSREEFNRIVELVQPNDNNLSRDTQWVLNCYKKNPEEVNQYITQLHSEDGRTGYLDIYNRLKTLNRIVGRERNLNAFRSMGDFIGFIRLKIDEIGDDEIWGDNDHRKKSNMTDAQKAAKNDVTKVYEDEVWYVVTPNTYEASVNWGKGTKWCTAYPHTDMYYNDYIAEGPLYINVNKNTKAKYQFHFPSRSFMNSNDMPIRKPVIEHIEGCTEGLKNFYESIKMSEEAISDFFGSKHNWTVVKVFEGGKIVSFKDNDDMDHNYGIVDTDNQVREEYVFDSYKIYSRFGLIALNMYSGGSDKLISMNNLSLVLGCEDDEYGELSYCKEKGYFMLLTDNEDVTSYYFPKDGKTLKLSTIEDVRVDKKYLEILEDIETEHYYVMYDGDIIYEDLFEPPTLTKSGNILWVDNNDEAHLSDIYGNDVIDMSDIDESVLEVLEINENSFALHLDKTRKWIIVDKQNNNIFNCEFDDIEMKTVKTPNIDGDETNYFIVKYKGKYNILTEKCKFLSPYVWFDKTNGRFMYQIPWEESSKSEQCAEVFIYGKRYFISTTGKLYNEDEEKVSDLREMKTRKLAKQINENLNNIFNIK